MNIAICNFKEISFIPDQFDTGVADFKKRKKQEVWFKAELEKNICGCACLLILSQSTARLSRLFVLPEYRGQGISKKLIWAREEFARAKKFKKIDTKTYLNYEKFGFQKKHVYKNNFYWWVKVLK